MTKCEKFFPKQESNIVTLNEVKGLGWIYNRQGIV